MPIDPKRVQAVFLAAVEQTERSARAVVLDRECSGDNELRRRVEALLRANDEPLSYFDQPPVGLPGKQAATEATTGFKATVSYSSPDPTPGAVIAGRYTLEQKLGEGGMGEVWVAKQSEPVKRRVALKLIKAGMDSKSVVQRFEQERQALAVMDHPNIAKVLDGGITADRRPYFVMELVNGLPLTKFCDETKLGIKERLELFVPICQAVQHAHQKGIVHRDLKPSNILVTMIDGKPVPKVIDFGVAKATGGKLTDESLSTQFGAVIGTLEYMSPEQAGFSNQDVDTRADIYSLGVILYELLTGLRPIDSKRLKQAALDEVIRIIREEEPSKPSTKLSTDESLPSLAAVRHIEPSKLTALLRGELDWIVMKCLEKQRDRRYESANGLARDIQRYLADELVEARPPNTGYRLQKFFRKNQGKVIAAGLVMLALLGGIIGTTWGLLLAGRAEKAASQDRDRALIAEGKAKHDRDSALAAEAEARAERDRVIKEKKRADANLALARKAVDDYLTRVSDDPELKDRTDFTSLRKRLLQSALLFYQQFVAQLGDDPESRAESARIYSMLANVRIESGEWAEAVKCFEAARQIYERLSVEQATKFEYRAKLISMTDRLAYAELRIHQVALSRQHYSEALKLAEQLVADFPNEAEALFVRAGVYFEGDNYGNDLFDEAIVDLRELVRLRPTEIRFLQQLSGALNNSATRHVKLNQLKEAELKYLESVDIDRKLFNSHPDNPDFRHRLANSLFNYGGFLRDRPKEALPLRDEAGMLLRQLTKDFSSNVRYRHMLARNQNEVGLLLVMLRKPSEAIAPLREAVLLMEQLPDDYPHPLLRRWRLADFLKDRAGVLHEQGQWEEAATNLGKNIRLLTASPSLFRERDMTMMATETLADSVKLYIRGAESQGKIDAAKLFLKENCKTLWSRKDARALISFALAYVQSGLLNEAVTEAEAIATAKPNSTEFVYDSACVVSLASGASKDAKLKEDYSKRAIELLNLAVKAGWKDVVNAIVKPWRRDGVKVWR